MKKRQSKSERDFWTKRKEIKAIIDTTLKYIEKNKEKIYEDDISEIVINEIERAGFVINYARGLKK